MLAREVKGCRCAPTIQAATTKFVAETVHLGKPCQHKDGYNRVEPEAPEIDSKNCSEMCCCLSLLAQKMTSLPMSMMVKTNAGEMRINFVNSYHLPLHTHAAVGRPLVGKRQQMVVK
jgi:hypothetical protein|mmetsp:Transcript_46143/g.75519  ORF Transcript_46143/g.75519 Transcript_46143/m.75519 type:complete len:117 (-) Transcript_46143:1123-1473(-)